MPAELTDYRAALRKRGDVAVGAYARRQRRWRFVLGLLGVALICGAGWVYLMLKSQDRGDSNDSHKVAIECVNCGYRGEAVVDAAWDALPIECPKCHERSCHKLWQCRACEKQFLPKGSSQDQDLVCPYCGSRRVGASDSSKPVTTAPADQQRP